MTNLKLENLKVGSEVVTIELLKNGNFKYGGVRIVTEFDEKFNVWRYAHPKNLEKNIGAFPPHGGQRYFMSKNKDWDYYFSANPTHIKAAIGQHKRARILAEKTAAKNKLRAEKFRVELDALLKKYGAEISAYQVSGDDQGVEVQAYYSVAGIDEDI